MQRAIRQEEVRGLMSQRTISNILMNPVGLFDFGNEPLDNLVRKIRTRVNVSTEKQIMLANLIDQYMDDYGTKMASSYLFIFLYL